MLRASPFAVHNFRAVAVVRKILAALQYQDLQPAGDVCMKVYIF